VRYALALSLAAHLAIFLVPGSSALRAPLAAAPLNVTFAASAMPVPAAPAPPAPDRPAAPPVLAAPARTAAIRPRPATVAPVTPSAPASVAEAAAHDPARSVNQLRTLLTSALAAHFRYPRLARQYGWQGRVQVDVRVDTDGQVHPLRVARSSGHSVLDRHALDTLAHIGALPSLVRWLDGKPVDVQVPIVYRLIDGRS